MKVEMCDLCNMDGDEKRAVAKYIDVEGSEWAVCPKHLKLVKKAGLEWWNIE